MAKKLLKNNIQLNRRILLTGGHAASSAFVVAEEIRRQKLPWDIYWIGFKSSIEGEKVSTLSSMFFPKYGIKTYNLYMGRIQRQWTVHTIPSLLKIPVGFVHSALLLLKIKPDVVLSFGGFSAYPVVFISYLLRIPVIIHEQTSVAGRANRYSSLFAKKIAISRETSRIYFPKSKTVLTGNPIPREMILSEMSGQLSEPISIMITGGQSGSVTLNNAVEKVLPSLVKKYMVVHLTGLKDETKFKMVSKRLGDKFGNNYRVYGIVDPKIYDNLFKNASLIISRAGANVVSKIIALKKPSILVPLPISYLNEQENNAHIAKIYAASRVIKQSDLTSKALINEIDFLIGNWNNIYPKIKSMKNPDPDAAEKIVSLLKVYIK